MAGRIKTSKALLADLSVPPVIVHRIMVQSGLYFSHAVNILKRFMLRCVYRNSRSPFTQFFSSSTVPILGLREKMALGTAHSAPACEFRFVLSYLPAT